MICPGRVNQQISVQPLSKKYSLFTSDPNHLHGFVVPPHKRGVSRSSRTLGAGCDGRGRCQKTNDIARGRQSRVVLTPRRWCQVSWSDPRKRRWQTSPVTGYRMHTSDSIYSISATKNVSHQSHLLRLRQYLMAQSGYPANPLKKIRFSKCVNLIAVTGESAE